MEERRGGAGDLVTGFLFGAGASVAAGYPLASQMRNAVVQFVERLPETAATGSLRRWTADVIALMERHRAQTIDELAFTLRTEANGLTTLRAKGVLTALFLDLENRDRLDHYRRAMRGWIDWTQLRLPEDQDRISVPSRCFALTYDYDRVLEAALFEEFRISRQVKLELEDRFQRLLNNGLNTMRQKVVPIDVGRFTILKMHGMIGTMWERPGLAARLPIEDFGKAVISDELLAEFRRDSAAASPTMIAFPWELPDLHDEMRAFVQETDRAAAAFLRRARVLHVVGYSHHPLNAGRLDGLLANAQGLRVLSVIDPDEVSFRRAEEVVARLGLNCDVRWEESTWPPQGIHAPSGEEGGP